MRFLWSAAHAWRQGKELDRRGWIRYVGWLSALSALAFDILATRYLPYVHTGELRGYLYLPNAYVGHFGSLAALFGLTLLPVAVLLPWRAVLLPASGLLLLAGLTLLALDTIVYAQYRFHLDGFVWDLLTGPGAREMFHPSWFSILALLTLALAIALLTLLALTLAVWLAHEHRLRGVGKYVFAGWLGAVLVAQSMHAWYEARYDAEIAGITRHFPLYYPLTAKRAFVELGWLDPSAVRRENLAGLDHRDESLRYPARPLECHTPDAPKNVLVIVIDAMRADTFSASVTPELFALGERDDALLFTDHFSGGNVTKSGIFSLFYGLPATYWDGFAAAGAGAEWIRRHQAAGYRIGVFSSATLQSPAFDRTVFASVPELRLSSEGNRPSERDRSAIDALDRFLASGAPDEPYFGFLFLDSAHGYDVPAGYEKFRPQWERVDHVKLNEHFDPEPYFNRYRNALHFLDERLGQLLERLSARGDLDDTVVVLTSDHGEEFNDLKQNYWGHGSNFLEYQTKVPLMILWPGKARQTIRHRTSHFDIAPTLMSEVLGCTNPMSDYSTGESLFDAAAERDWLLVHSYYNYGVVTDDQVITTYPVGGYEARDLDDGRLADARLDVRTEADILREVSRFYR